MLDALVTAMPGDPAVDPADTLRAMIGRPDWHRHAGCRSIGTDPFFPVRGGSLDLARHLCSTCPVTAKCLAEALALDAKDDHGFRAGMSAKKRRLLRRSTAA